MFARHPKGQSLSVHFVNCECLTLMIRLLPEKSKFLSCLEGSFDDYGEAGIMINETNL